MLDAVSVIVYVNSCVSWIIYCKFGGLGEVDYLRLLLMSEPSSIILIEGLFSDNELRRGSLSLFLYHSIKRDFISVFFYDSSSSSSSFDFLALTL